jgi:anaerobic ribonucleoside-triphosphate reductase activating protein
VNHKSLKLSGLVPFSTVDYPGHLCAVLFTQGCPLRCRYCHNPHLRPRTAQAAQFWPAMKSWLGRRVGLLDAVVFSGGEPTAQTELPEALADTREMGFATGLHTSGVLPQRLERVLPLLDWIGLDIKAPFTRYAAITGNPGSGARARRALEAVLARGINYELRTTVHAALLDDRDLMDIARTLEDYGVRRWVLQKFRPQGCDDAYLTTSNGSSRLETLLPSLQLRVPNITVR